MTLPVHLCTEPECPFVGQRTTNSCGCHKTTEQMLVEERAELLATLKNFENWVTSFDPENQKSRFAGRKALIEARAVIAKAEAR